VVVVARCLWNKRISNREKRRDTGFQIKGTYGFREALLLLCPLDPSLLREKIKPKKKEGSLSRRLRLRGT
jgi:hypothetical protein